MLTLFLLAPVCFLVGTIPTGLVIARSRGIDIRQHGSGNIGATNVARVLGKRLGLLCFVIDLLKGLVPTVGAGIAGGALGRSDLPVGLAWAWLLAMAMPILGHMFSPWVSFKGGKGVATGLGCLLGVFPQLTFAALGALAVWIVAVAVWRYVGLASCLAALTLPGLAAATAWARGGPQGPVAPSAWPFLVTTSLLAALVIVKHRGNLARTWKGTESKIGQRVAAPDPPAAR